MVKNIVYSKQKDDAYRCLISKLINGKIVDHLLIDSMDDKYLVEDLHDDYMLITKYDEKLCYYYCKYKGPNNFNFDKIYGINKNDYIEMVYNDDVYKFSYKHRSYKINE